MYKIILSLVLAISLALFAQKIPITKDTVLWKVFENQPKPVFQVIPSKTQYLPGEAVVIRFLLKNESDKRIPIFEKALRNSTISATVGIYGDKDTHTGHCYSVSLCDLAWSGYGTYEMLEPGESVFGDHIIEFVADKPQDYYIHANYYWRPCNPKPKSTEIGGACQNIRSDPVKISVVESISEEHEAFKFIPNFKLLAKLQSPLYSCTPACLNDPTCEDTPDFYIAHARKFLERFPKSAYARYINYTMAVMLKDQKRFADAETQMGKFISLYPGDWMVDDAMFEMAECQLEQGQADKAQATLESLLQKYPLTSAHMAKRVLENLKKGYRTMDQVYSH